MEILNFKESPPGAYEKATFDLDFGPKWGIGVADMRLCVSKNGHYYVQSKQTKTEEMKNGKNVYKPIFYTYGDKGKDLNKAVLDLLQPHVEKLGTRKEENFDYF